MNSDGLFSEERSAEVVAASFDGTPDPRLRRVLQSLVRHLHAFVKDVELTEAEWEAAIAFLTATGHKCDGVRQEFVLLSDVLGVSMLVETINHRAGGATESTVLGPFHKTHTFRSGCASCYLLPAGGVEQLLAAAPAPCWSRHSRHSVSP